MSAGRGAPSLQGAATAAGSIEYNRRVLSFFSMFTDVWTRLRYRRAELSRLAPATLTSEPEAIGEPPLWVPLDRTADGSSSVLNTPVGCRAFFHLTLPAAARIVSHCDLVNGAASIPDGGAGAEFTISATIDGRESARSCRVFAGSPARRRGGILSLEVPAGGTAAVVLISRPLGAVTPGWRAIWTNPRVEWRRPARQLAAALADVVRRRRVVTMSSRQSSISSEQQYRLWVREQEPSKQMLRSQRQAVVADVRVFTLITHVSDASRRPMERTIESVLGQTYPHWEWLMVGPGASVIAAARRDSRVRVVAPGESASPAAQLDCAMRAAGGEFAAILGERDTLEPTALFNISRAAKDADVVYSDEDRIDDKGRRSDPAFKPEWSPDLLLACNYIGRLAMIRVTAALDSGGIRDGFGTAWEWELVLRLARAPARFRRVPACLYHRHAPEPAVSPDDRAAVLRDHGRRIGLEVEVTGSASASRLRWPLDRLPKVSVVIPNRNAFAVLEKCVVGLLEGTSYPNHELVIVDNGSTEPAVLDLYARLEREGHGRVVRFERPFNFSAACNAGAAAARGDLLLFLNNDIEIVDPEWMEELVRWALRPGVGVVGAKLLYPDRMIQHAGVVFGLGLVGHIFARAAEGTTGVFGSTEWYRNYMAVTGACQMVPRAVFEGLGGYDERLRLSFSDVVLCLEAWSAGYRVVYTPYARLIHHESYTRQKQDSAEDMELFADYLRRTGFVEDPYLHPDLDPRSLVPRIRTPFEPGPRHVIAQFLERVLAAAHMN